MSIATRDRAPAPPALREQTTRRPVMLASIDIGYDEEAVEAALAAALEANSELLVCLGVTLPVANANAAARRHMGDPVVREQIAEILRTARRAGATARPVLYNTPRPIAALIEIADTHALGLLVFGPDRRSYGRLRFRWHLRRIKRNAPCLVLPLE